MDNNDQNGAAPAAGDRVGKYLDPVLGGIAAAILFCLMMLTFVDVVGRDFFNAPVPGGFEITQLMMAALIFTALPVVSWKEQHIVIDLFDALIPRAVTPYLQAVISLISAVAMFAMTRQTWLLAVELQGYNEITEYLRAPVWPVVYLISVMCGFATIALVLNIWRHVTGRMSAGSADTQI